MKQIVFTFLTALLVSSLSHGAGQQHDVKVFVPQKFDANKRYALVVLLHGYLENREFIDHYFGYSRQVDKRGFILIVPNGLRDSHGKRYWNASEACCDFDHRKNDDLGYLKGLIDKAIAKYPVDLSRVFVTGHSNGGFMAHTLACNYSEVVTGVISLAGVMPTMNESCKYVKPVSVLQIHAVNDETIKFGGDPVGYPTLSGYPSVAQTVSSALKLNSCTKISIASEKLNLTHSIPGADTERTFGTGCDANSSVELWKLKSHSGLLHSGHAPLLRDEFTNRTLDFIFSHPRN